MDETDNNIKEDSFITMANERAIEGDDNPGSIISLYAAALRDAERSLKCQIGEYNWETEVAPLLVKGIKSFFKQRGERLHHSVEIEHENDTIDIDATENNNIDVDATENEMNTEAQVHKAKMHKRQLNSQRQKEESKKCGKPRLGQEEGNDRN